MPLTLDKNIIDMTENEMRIEIFNQIDLLVKGESDQCNAEVWINMLISSLTYEHWKRGYIDGLCECGVDTKLTSKVQ